MRTLIATCVALLMLGSAGCVARAANSTPPENRLLGTWYDDSTGAQYIFASDGVLVVPTPQTNHGNAVTYKLLADNRLDVITGDSHRVSDIETVTADKLVLTDPVSGHRQPLMRSAGATRYATRLLYGAIRHLTDVGGVSAATDIVWVAPKPRGKGTEWTAWSASTIDPYLQSWDWTGLKRAATPVATAGAGTSMGYEFSVLRHVSSEASLTSTWTTKSVEPTAGLRIVDVGYSITKTDYPPGTLVYLPGGMIYSLGDGYAIAVGRDLRAKSFVPLTHK
jgi:hypothetical protein